LRLSAACPRASKAYMTILYTMVLVGLLGLALHFELYWAAGALVVLYLFLLWFTRRSSR
jgi:hypothetical protein